MSIFGGILGKIFGKKGAPAQAPAAPKPQAAPAAAQPSPLSVNDCTLLPDPGALRRCLDQAEGRVVAPLPPVAGPATSERPEQVVQAARGAPVAKPGAKPGALPPTDFLGNRREPAPRAHPSGRTVIDLQ